MPTVKHDNRFVENNPRNILDEELPRYCSDGWYIIQSESTPRVEKPVEINFNQINETKSVKVENSIVLPEINIEKKNTETITAKPIDQFINRHRGRPKKY